MGYPVGPHYAECSNIESAARLRGKLMLIVGEMDTNVPTESTFRLADALIRAGKDFDLVVVPGAGHGMGALTARGGCRTFSSAICKGSSRRIGTRRSGAAAHVVRRPAALVNRAI
ncbi:MAG: prolyl oligopeptidase family serine peptidase [Pirellulaceae bacterium]